MPLILVNVTSCAPALRKAISTLKAALVVSAAAILSQAQADLEANTAAAWNHLDEVAARLSTLRDDVIRDGASPGTETPTPEVAGKEIDGSLLDLLTNVVGDRIANLKQALHDVVGSPERDGLDAFVASVGELGTAVDDFTVLLTASPSGDAIPFSYDQFFLESTQELSERDWSAT